MALAKENQKFTVEDYLCWPDEPRCELIHGQIWDMSPAPSIEHQELVAALHVEIAIALREEEKTGRVGGSGNCKLLFAPVDVVLAYDSVVQPDLIVVCDPAKLANGKNVQGAPDLVLEVLSPATGSKDKREKKALYEQAGVPIYLIVDPVCRLVERYDLKVDGYGVPQILNAEDKLELAFVPSMDSPLGKLLGWPMPSHKRWEIRELDD